MLSKKELCTLLFSIPFLCPGKKYRAVSLHNLYTSKGSQLTIKMINDGCMVLGVYLLGFFYTRNGYLMILSSRTDVVLWQSLSFTSVMRKTLVTARRKAEPTTNECVRYFCDCAIKQHGYLHCKNDSASQNIFRGIVLSYEHLKLSIHILRVQRAVMVGNRIPYRLYFTRTLNF